MELSSRNHRRQMQGYKSALSPGLDPFLQEPEVLYKRPFWPLEAGWEPRSRAASGKKEACRAGWAVLTWKLSGPPLPPPLLGPGPGHPPPLSFHPEVSLPRPSVHSLALLPSGYGMLGNRLMNSRGLTDHTQAIRVRSQSVNNQHPTPPCWDLRPHVWEPLGAASNSYPSCPCPPRTALSSTVLSKGMQA